MNNRNLAVGYAILGIRDKAGKLPDMFRDHEVLSVQDERTVKDIKNLCLHVLKHGVRK